MDAKGDLNSSDKYRCIYIVGSLSKLFDLIMLHMLKGMVDISSAQFGFRAGQSPIFVVIFLRGFSADLE